MTGTETGTRKKVDGMNMMMTAPIVWSPRGKKAIWKYKEVPLPVFILE
jgi:hypothetical protein